MRLCHTRPVAAASFDEPNLVSAAGLVPVLRLAADAALGEPASALLTVPTDKGANASGKVTALVAGMPSGPRRAAAPASRARDAEDRGS